MSTGADFRDLLLAVAASPADAAKPTKFDQFVASHPAVPATFASAASQPASPSRSISASMRSCSRGRKEAGSALSDDARARGTPRSRRCCENATRFPYGRAARASEARAGGPVTFHFKAQLAAPGDSTADPAKPWPADRKVVELGTLTIDHAVADSAEAQKALLFLPGLLTDGIEQSDDPLIDVRDGASAESFARRNP